MSTAIIEALSQARERLTVVRGEITRLEQAAHTIRKRPPHTDDIVEAFRRGLQRANADFEQRLGWHLNNANAKAPDVAASVAEAAPQLLSLSRLKPGYQTLMPFGGVGYEQGELDLPAVTYFLSGTIAAAVPGLVAKLCPGASDGMKEADRKAALADVDAQLEPLRQEQSELLASLESVRTAASA